MSHKRVLSASSVAHSAMVVLALSACSERAPTVPTAAMANELARIGSVPTFTIVDLGTLAPPGFVRASAGAWGINNPGRIVGQAQSPDPGGSHASEG